jgi:hypothetical protein
VNMVSMGILLMFVGMACGILWWHSADSALEHVLDVTTWAQANQLDEAHALVALKKRSDADLAILRRTLWSCDCVARHSMQTLSGVLFWSDTRVDVIIQQVLVSNLAISGKPAKPIANDCASKWKY